eukprot:3332751-Amphidinium_carterae.4
MSSFRWSPFAVSVPHVACIWWNMFGHSVALLRESDLYDDDDEEESYFQNCPAYSLDEGEILPCPSREGVQSDSWLSRATGSRTQRVQDGLCYSDDLHRVLGCLHSVEHDEVDFLRQAFDMWCVWCVAVGEHAHALVNGLCDKCACVMYAAQVFVVWTLWLTVMGCDVFWIGVMCISLCSVHYVAGVGYFTDSGAACARCGAGFPAQDQFESGGACGRTRWGARILFDPQWPPHCLFEAMAFCMRNGPPSMEDVGMVRCAARTAWEAVASKGDTESRELVEGWTAFAGFSKVSQYIAAT